MNNAKIDQLKAKAELSGKTYSDEKARLEGLGLKSQERYEILKPLKAIADADWSEYKLFAEGQIKKELNKIIKADAPIRASAARSRSAWKMAKYNMAKGI